MTQYLIQIQTAPNGVGVGWLAKSFVVSESSPIPTSWPANRVQVVMTNTDSYTEIVAVYAEYRENAIFSYDAETGKINCSGAYTGSWDIN